MKNKPNFGRFPCKKKEEEEVSGSFHVTRKKKKEVSEDVHVTRKDKEVFERSSSNEEEE
jgi:hypothetical protein